MTDRYEPSGTAGASSPPQSASPQSPPPQSPPAQSSPAQAPPPQSATSAASRELPPPPSSRELLPQRVSRWLDGGLTRLGVTGPFGRDCVLALVVATGSVALFAALLLLAPPESELNLSAARSGWIVAAAGAQALALCLRRIRPYLCLAVTVGCQLAMIVVAPDLSFRGVAPIIAGYTIGTLATIRTMLVVAVAAALAEGTAGVVGAALAAGSGPLLTGSPATQASAGVLLAGVNHLTSAAVLYPVAAFVGSYVATRRRYLEMVRTQAVAEIKAQQARLRTAIVAERTQIARELHDVAAHHLSSMVVQAAAVERLIERDPSAARSGAAWIRRQGRETLDNLRQVVGLLRSPDGPGSDGTAPLPGVAALEDLVRTARDLGTEVEFGQEGTALALPPIADVSLYRVAQQALTNARQHAPGAPVRMRLAYGDRAVVLDIVNDGAAPGPDPERGPHGGTGLVSMRERAELVGAELAAGPTGDGGWRVHLRLPVHSADSAVSRQGG